MLNYNPRIRTTGGQMHLLGYRLHRPISEQVMTEQEPANRGVGNIPAQGEELRAHVHTMTAGDQSETMANWPPPPVVDGEAGGVFGRDAGPAEARMIAPQAPWIERHRREQRPCDISDLCWLMEQLVFGDRYQRMSLPEWHFAPFQSVEHGFRLESFNDTAVSDGAGTFTDVTSVSLPTGMAAVVTHFGQWANNAAAFNNATWRIVVDSGPSDSLFSFSTQLGSLVEPARLGTPIYVPRGGTITVQVQNSTSALDNYKAILRGWRFVPIEDQPGVNRMRTDWIRYAR